MDGVADRPDDWRVFVAAAGELTLYVRSHILPAVAEAPLLVVVADQTQASVPAPVKVELGVAI